MSEVWVEVSMCVGIGRERGTYTVQVEGVWGTGSGGASRERDLDGRVVREGVDAAAWEKVCCALGAREDLEEDGDRGRNEGRAIDEELGTVLSQ